MDHLLLVPGAGRTIHLKHNRLLLLLDLVTSQAFFAEDYTVSLGFDKT